MYNNSKIYKLWSQEGNDVFIGATIQPLEQKLKLAKYEKNKNDIFSKYEKIEIELLLDYPCNSSLELKKKLNEYILNNDCVNEIKLRNDLDPKIMIQKEKRKEHDTKVYYKDVEQSRRLKIIQKISREGQIPTETSIKKYNISITELLKIQDYLGNIKEEGLKNKLNTKLFDRIRFINEIR